MAQERGRMKSRVSVVIHKLRYIEPVFEDLFCFSRNELKMFHAQILSRNEAWFLNIRKQMTTEKKIPTSQQTSIISYIFRNSFVFHIHSCIIVVYCIECYWGSSVSTAVNEGRGYRCRCIFLERGESVPLSLYFISILWRCIPQTPK